jgi:L-histidine Nalpha-methyltransferase
LSFMSFPARAVPRIDVQVHLGPEDRREALIRDVRDGLTHEPKLLQPKWFYDERGSELFEEITRLPEYYLTRREREILDLRAPEIAAAAGADTLVELGSGTSEKTLLLLDALHAGGTLARFMPFDVSETTLRGAADVIAERYPGVEVHGVVGDFEVHLGKIPGGGRRLVAFLGGTIGNLYPEARREFLGRLADLLEPGDSLLLGTDLIKDHARLEAAYDDAQGVTAEFNKNVLTVLNRELGADFDLDAFEHVARYDAAEARMDIRLRSLAHQAIRLGELDLTVEFAAGEEMRTEISAKFTRERLERVYAEAGLAMGGWFTDPAGDYALSLGRPL